MLFLEFAREICGSVRTLVSKEILFARIYLQDLFLDVSDTSTYETFTKKLDIWLVFDYESFLWSLISSILKNHPLLHFLSFFRKRRRSSDTFLICLICGELCCTSIWFLRYLNVKILVAIFLMHFYAPLIPIKVGQEALPLHPNDICTLWCLEVNLQLLV